MKRRYILASFAALLSGAASIGVLRKHVEKPKSTQHPADFAEVPNFSIGKNRQKFRVVTSWPKDFPGLADIPKRIRQSVYELTQGRIDMEIYAAGELVGALECFDAVSTGAADMYHSAEYYWHGKSVDFNFFTGMPMGFTATEHTSWIEHGGGQKLWDNLSAEFNIKALGSGNTGHQMGGWFKREINSLDDMRGLKMRMPGLGGEVLRRIGTAAVQLPGSEIYQALQSGTIDGTEWVGPWNDYAFGFYREAPYYYGPGFHEPSAELTLGINLRVWQSLSSADQVLFQTVARAVGRVTTAQYTHENARALQILKTKHNIEPKPFPKDVWKALTTHSHDVVDELATGSARTRRIHTSYSHALKQYHDWTQLGEGQYIHNRSGS